MLCNDAFKKVGTYYTTTCSIPARASQRESSENEIVIAGPLPFWPEACYNRHGVLELFGPVSFAVFALRNLDFNIRSLTKTSTITLLRIITTIDIYTFCAFYLTYFLAFYLAYLLAFYLAYLLAYYLANLLAFYLAYLVAFILSDILSGKSSGICSGKHSGTLSGIPFGILSDILSGVLSGISH